MARDVCLHFNELPYEPQRDALRAAQKACRTANRYPKWDTGDLRSALAQYCGLPYDWVVVANGSLMIIHQVMIASGQREVAYCWPSFVDYPTLAEGLRMSIRPTLVCPDGSCDLDDLAKNITPDTSMVVVCTPNVPTGGVVKHAAMERFLKKVPTRVTVMIDEAYVDFARDDHMVRSLEIVRNHPNVVISRSFSKAQGLAGMRVGYALAQPQLAEKIAAAGLPRFHISAPSAAAALATLNHKDEMQARIEEIIRERDRMAAALRKLGAEVVSGHGNFIWLPVGNLAKKLGESLAAHNVLVSVLQPFGVRISAGTSEDTDRLVDAWQKVQPLTS
jgi:histidinol-phosphate aminotransferase